MGSCDRSAWVGLRGILEAGAGGLKIQPLSAQVHILTHIYTRSYTPARTHTHTASLTHTHTLLATVPSKAQIIGTKLPPAPAFLGAPRFQVPWGWRAGGGGERSHLNGDSSTEGLRAVTPLPCTLDHLILTFPHVQAPDEISVPRMERRGARNCTSTRSRVL